MARITVAQLQARISELEAQLASITAERDALLVAQRPSRTTTAPTPALAPTPAAPTHTDAPEGKVWVADLGRFLPVGFAKAREAAMRCGNSVRIG